MRGVIWRAAPAKFKRGMCEIKILGSDVSWCILYLKHWFRVGTHARCNLFRQSSKQVCEMKILRSEVL